MREAWAGFSASASAEDRADLTAWSAAEVGWLADYGLFMALEAAHGGAPWWTWPAPLARRDPAALSAARARHADEIAFWTFVQWCFDRQLAALKAHANARGIGLVGDLPIFVAHHSADCWARPDLYHLGADGQPSVVAGVPPDFFSATGQRWGNPLYDWRAMAADGYRWWTDRVRRMLAQADVFRIDHFRGFAACWEIPATSPTAIDGRWVPGPGRALFEAIEAALGRLPIIAEDLGIITPDVEALRDDCGFPGMRILQFAFGGDGRHAYLPHNHVPASVVYTGTHDNDTCLGWWRDAATPAERHAAGCYLGALGHDACDLHWAMVRAASTSVARTAIFPLQDVLGLDGSHRMNVPGRMGGHWAWRFDEAMLGDAGRVLRDITAISGRTPG
ncbi:4-alpha-glucanotransferase [Piscinibacter sakaiensis]|uniref:4-alpha-glucanotransferase n=1 Tax=Piscinibacter sakaiensis TaxID=1547922 RepID=UPI00372A284D